MPTRASRPENEDANQAAFRTVRQLTRDADEALGDAFQPVSPPSERKKNPAAVALGKLGASKGGKARAAKLSKKRRSEIARDAARKRWERGNGSDL